MKVKKLSVLPSNHVYYRYTTHSCFWQDVSFSFLSFFFFWDRVSLCIPGCPGTHSVDQAGLKLRNPPPSASQVLGLKACATTAQLGRIFLKEVPLETELCIDVNPLSSVFHQVSRDGRLRSRGGAPLPILVMALYGRVFERDPPRLGQGPGKLQWSLHWGPHPPALTQGAGSAQD
jgi:hypothetical protein